MARQQTPDPYQADYERAKASPGFGRPTYGSSPPPQPDPRHAAPPGQPRQFATPEEAYQAGQRDATRKLTTPRMTGYRVACGICWAIWTFLLVVAAFISFASGSAVGILALALAGLTGWYDYRIWALKARYLTILFIF